jgi:hypothetical protein
VQIAQTFDRNQDRPVAIPGSRNRFLYVSQICCAELPLWTTCLDIATQVQCVVSPDIAGCVAVTTPDNMYW